MLTYEIGFLDSKNDSFNPLILEILLLFFYTRGIEWSHSVLKCSKNRLCSNCSQKLDVNSHAPARKVFATARMLGVLLKFSAM